MGDVQGLSAREVKDYIRYIVLADKIDAPALFAETQRLENKIFESYGIK